MAGFVYLASSNLDTFTNARTDDMIITTSCNAQNILIGNQSNSASIISITSNRVGIAKSNPGYALDVVGDINFTSGLFQNGSLFQTSRWSSNALGAFILSNVGVQGVPSSCNQLLVYGAGGIGLSNAGYTFIAASNGFLGVGLSNPAFALDVAGGVNFTTGLFQNGTLFQSSRWTSNATGISILSNVGIGAGPSSTARLLVTGTAGQVKVQLSNDMTTNRGIVMWDSFANEHQFYGMGINAATFRFQIESNVARYAWFTGTSTTTSTELMRLLGTGELGVGTTTPAERLHIAGKAYASGQVLADSNTTSNVPAFSFLQDSNTGMYSAGVDALGLVTGGVERLRVTDTGFVGVGTSTPRTRFTLANPHGNSNTGLCLDASDFSTTYAMHIHSFVQASGQVGYTFNVQNSAASNTAMVVGFNGNIGMGTSNPSERLIVVGKAYASGQVLANSNTTNAAPAFSFLQDSNTGMYNAGADALGLVTGGVERFRVTDAGNVGINTTTPNLALDVRGMIGLHGSATWDHLYMYHDGGAAVIRAGGAENGLVVQVGSAGTGTYGEASQNYTTAIVCLPSGNVGVGTSSPAQRLHVAGKIYSTTQILNNSNDSATAPSFSFLEDSNTGMFHPSNDVLGFSTAGTERIRVTDTGLVGIGADIVPVARFDITASIQHPPLAITSAPGYIASSSGTFPNVAFNPNFAFDYNNASLWASVEAAYNGTTGAYQRSPASSTTVSGTAYTGEWLQLQLPVARAVQAMLFLGNGLRRFVIAGSQDATTWTSVLIRDSGSEPALNRDTNHIITFSNTTAYLYYRFIIREAIGGQVGGGFDVNELRFLEAPPNNRALRVGPTTGVDSVIVDLTGNVGIGDVPSTARLHVAGNAMVSGSITGSNFIGNGAGLSNLNATHITTGTLGVALGGTGATVTTGAGSNVLNVTPVLSGATLSGNTSNTGLIIGGTMSNTGLSNPTVAGGSLSNVSIAGPLSGLLTVTVASNVGIGITSPSERLHVTGKIYSTAQILNNSNDSATAPSFSFFEDSNTGMFHPSNDALGFTTAGTERIRVTDTGVVGIGTANPSARLHVAGTAGQTKIQLSNDVTTNRGIVLGEIAANEHQFSGIGINDSTFRFQIDGTGARYAWFTGTSSTASTELMRLTGTGNLGIGTTAPSERLSVAGNAVVNGSLTIMGGTGCNMFGSADAGNLSQTYITFGPNGSTDDFASLRQIGGTNSIQLALDFHDDTGDAGFSIRDVFSSVNPDGAPQTRFIVRRGGNVGVGIESPTELLHVAGKIYSTTQFLNNSNDSATAPSFSFFEDSNTGMFHPSNDALGFSTAGTERIRITDTGYVGLGTATPRTRFTLVNSYNDSNTGLCLDASDGVTYTLQIASFVQGGAQVGYRFNVQNQTASNTAMVLGHNGNVGLGANSPSERLHVVGKILSSMQYLNEGGSNSNMPCYSFLANSNTGMYNASNNAVGFVTGGTERVRIDHLGNMGIGTSNPAHRLDINGTCKVTNELYVGNAGGSGIIYMGGGAAGDSGYDHSVIETRNYASSESTELLLFKGNDAPGPSGPDRIRLRAGTIAFDTYASASIDRNSEGIRMTIDGTGNVGIGTASPAQRLHVAGKIYSTEQFLNNSNDSATAPSFSFLEDSNTGMFHPSNDTLGFSTAGLERIRVTDSGNVGVGTSNPTSLLEVGGTFTTCNVTVNGNINLNNALIIRGLEIMKNNGTMANTTTTSVKGLSNVSAGMNFTVDSNTSAYRFAFLGNTTEVARLTGDGNLGIGTTTPTANLHVNGSVRIRTGTANSIMFNNNASGGTTIMAHDANELGGVYRLMRVVASNIQFAVGTNSDQTIMTLNSDNVGNNRNVQVSGTLLSDSLLVGTTAADTAATRLVIEKSDGTTAATGAYLVIKNQNSALATNGVMTTAGGVLFSSYRDVRNPSYTAGITYEALGISGLFTGASMVFRTTDGAAVNFSDGASALPPERARITAAGNFGIGTTTPSERLHVAGNVNTNALVMTGTKSEWLDGAIRLYRTMTGADSSVEFFITRGFTTASRNHLVLHAFNAATCGVQIMSTGEVLRLFVNTNNGNVGIGTSNNTSRFCVVGNAGQPKIQINNDTTTNRGIVLWDDNNNEHQFYGMGINNGVLRHQIPTTSTCYAWFTGTSASASTELMRLEGNGNLGIGTTTPATRLHVVGGSTFAGRVSCRPAPAGEARYHLYNVGSTAEWVFGQPSSTVHDWVLSTVVNSAETERFRVTHTGNVGIGTSTPSAPLDVVVPGNVHCTIRGPENPGLLIIDQTYQRRAVITLKSQAADPALQFYNLGSNGVFPANTLAYNFLNSNATATLLGISATGNVGIGTFPSYPLHVTGAGANNISIFAANDIASFSDARVKKDLTRISNALSKVMSISGYTFTRTDVPAPAKRQCGVLAQEVLAVLPEVVGEDPQTGMYNVAYGNITALLIEAIKEMKTTYDTQIATLNKRINDLEAKISI